MTEAERALARLRPDYEQAMRDFMAEAVRIGDHDAVERLEALARSEHSANATNLLNQEIQALVRAKMAELGYDVSLVVLGSSLMNDVSARIKSYADGSSLVLVSNGLLALADHYARHLVIAQPTATGAVELDHELLATTLRYRNLHHRIYGLAAGLALRLDEDRMTARDKCNMYVHLFVVAHEFAHHALGHLAGEATAPHEPNADLHLEVEADELAFRVIESVVDGADTPFVGLGPLIAMVAVHCAERGVFIRPGTTHPRAIDRARSVLDKVTGQWSPSLRTFFGDVIRATDDACDFTPEGPVVNWTRTLTHPAIYTPHPVEYLKMVVKLDDLHSSGPAHLLDWLQMLDREHGTDAMRGARAAADGHAEEALAAWGMTAEKIAHVMAPDITLSYFALMDGLRKSMPGIATLEKTARGLYGICAASLVQGSLGGMSA